MIVPAEDVLDLLLHLVDKSMVIRQEGVDDAGNGRAGREGARQSGRYRLLETLREYGRERLAELGAEKRVRRRHCVHYLGLVERAATEEPGAYRDQGPRRLDAERENLWAALRWAHDQADAETRRRLTDTLSQVVDRLASPAVRMVATPLVFELRRLKMPEYALVERRLLEHGHAAVLAAGADLYRTIGDRVAELAVLKSPEAASRGTRQ
jgi:hypothetical protein